MVDRDEMIYLYENGFINLPVKNVKKIFIKLLIIMNSLSVTIKNMNCTSSNFNKTKYEYFDMNKFIKY